MVYGFTKLRVPLTDVPTDVPVKEKTFPEPFFEQTETTEKGYAEPYAEESALFSMVEPVFKKSNNAFLSAARWFLLVGVAVSTLFAAFYFFPNPETELRIPVEDGVEDGAKERTAINLKVAEKKSGTIGNDGGEIVLSDGAKIIIPKGAVDDDTEFEIERIAQKGSFTDLYHFKPDGFVFDKPVTISIPFREEKMPVKKHIDDIIFRYGDSPVTPRAFPPSRVLYLEKIMEMDINGL